MQKHMVEEAGSRFFEMASSLGRMHERTLAGLADATSKTPLGPVFAINASLARMANEGMDTLASRMTVATAPASAEAPQTTAKTADAPKSSTKPAPKAERKATPKPLATPAEKPSVAASPKPAPATSATPAAKPKRAKKAAPSSVETSPATVVVEAKPPAKSNGAIAKDDLTRINGIGATTAKKLHGAGIEHFAQIADMSEHKFTKLLASLEVKSIRFSPKLWIEEAKTLVA